MSRTGSPTAITIASLRDAPEALPVCARWLNEEWGQTEGHSLEVTADRLSDVIAPVGVCLLAACNLETQVEHTPWISDFYVLPHHRRRSIDTRLLGAIEEAARHGGETRSIFVPTRPKASTGGSAAT